MCINAAYQLLVLCMGNIHTFEERWTCGESEKSKGRMILHHNHTEQLLALPEGVIHTFARR